jgi:hypothetical protein
LIERKTEHQAEKLHNSPEPSAAVRIPHVLHKVVNQMQRRVKKRAKSSEHLAYRTLLAIGPAAL